MDFIKLKELFEIIPIIILVIIFSKPIRDRLFPPFTIALIWYASIIIVFMTAVSTAVKRLEDKTLSFMLFLIIALVYLFHFYKKSGEISKWGYIKRIGREYIEGFMIDYKGKKKKGLYLVFSIVGIILEMVIVVTLLVSIINIFINIFYDIKNNNFNLSEIKLSLDSIESFGLLIIFIIIATLNLVNVSDSIIYYKDKVENRKKANLLKVFIDIFEISLQQCSEEEKDNFIELLFEQNGIPNLDLNNKIREFHTIQSSSNSIEKVEGAIGELSIYILCELRDRNLYNKFYKICLENKINMKNTLKHINDSVMQSKEVDILGIDIINNSLELKDKILNKFL